MNRRASHFFLACAIAAATLMLGYRLLVVYEPTIIDIIVVSFLASISVFHFYKTIRNVPEESNKEQRRE